MARGKLLKTKIKEAVIEASALQESIRLGNLKAEDKINEKKSLFASLRGHIGRIIDRIDPLELFAVVSGAFVIYEIIAKTAKLVDALGKLSQAGSAGTGGLSVYFFNALMLMFGQYNVFTAQPNQTTPVTITNQQGLTIAISFLASWLIFKRGGIAETSAIPTVTGILSSLGVVVA